MAIKGLSSGEREEYICRDDPCKTREEGATVFYIRNLPSTVQTRLHDMQGAAQMNFGDAQTQTFVNRTAARNREAFKFGVDGWDNFVDDDDQPIKFETRRIIEAGAEYTVVSDDCLDRVRLATINEVGAEIYNKSTLSEPARKKLEEVSLLFGGSDTSNARTARPNSKRNGGVSNPRQPLTGSTRRKKPKTMPGGKTDVLEDQS